MSAPWLTKESVAQLAGIKRDHPDGLDVFTAMAVAAHKQWGDVEVLLGLVPEVLDEGDTEAQVRKIQARHEAYREAAKGRTDSVFP